MIISRILNELPPKNGKNTITMATLETLTNTTTQHLEWEGEHMNQKKGNEICENADEYMRSGQVRKY